MEASAGFATKKRLFDALHTLVHVKPYKSIKVAELCEAAGVSRAAFYNHFDNKQDILAWHSDRILAAGLDEIGISLTWYEGHLVTTKGIQCFYDFYNLCRPFDNGGDLFHSRHAQHRSRVIRRTITEVKGLEVTEKLGFQINALANCEEWAIRDWYRGGIDVSIEEICEYMVSIVPRDLYHILEKPEKPARFEGEIIFKNLLAEMKPRQ